MSSDPMQFTLKDSGERLEFSTGMKRDVTTGKPRFDLVIPKDVKFSMFERWAEHMRKGAEKYGDRNWEQASTPEELDRFRESAIRHFMQWWFGERDEDHAAAVFFNIQGAEYVMEKLED